MSKYSIAKISTKKKYETNPFIKELEGKMYLQPRVNMALKKEEIILNKTTGEIKEEVPLVGKRKIVDKSQFAKIYATEIGMLFNLSKTALNVFMHLTSVMDYENKAFFNWKKIYKNYGSAYRGVKELILNNIIAPSLIQNVYWLNPMIVCKGERFAVYQEYVTQEYAEKEGFATPEHLLKKQGRENMQKLPENTKNKIKAMNDKAEKENRENNPYGDTIDMFLNDNSPYK